MSGDAERPGLSPAGMPSHETDVVNERVKFVAAAQSGRWTRTELCERFGVSRKTGYKLLERYRAAGVDGLRDRSRAPWTQPNQVSPELEAAILRARKAHPTWGSKKLLVVLQRQWPLDELPARSTVDSVPKRAGVVRPRRPRVRRQPSWKPEFEALEPNEVWSIDYKGWFRVGDGERCDPLTVNDVFSRYSLECRALVAPKLEDVRLRLERLFWKHGLPRYELNDNGPPFGSNGLGRLSRLGVQPIFIEPGHPEQNGRHERFHETLEAETATPPRASIRAQQAAVDRFRAECNDERPHEALGMRTPSQRYASSRRQMPIPLGEHEYPETVEVRRDGTIKWDGGYVFIGEAMVHELIGLECIDEARWRVRLGPMRLGVLHERSRTVVSLAERADQPGVTHVLGQPSSTNPQRDKARG